MCCILNKYVTRIIVCRLEALVYHLAVDECSSNIETVPAPVMTEQSEEHQVQPLAVLPIASLYHDQVQDVGVLMLQLGVQLVHYKGGYLRSLIL
jgi:hypothetical protein